MTADRYEPIAAVAARWVTDPDFNAAYSYLRPGGTPADRDRVAALLHGGLLLAGEATWREHPGTVHGAWFSGERAARTLLEQTGPRRVVVVGAGLAGIAAARHLRAHGVEVAVLEAAPVAGGRVRTDRSLGAPVHLGAAWFHGEGGNPVAAVARALDARLTPSRWAQTVPHVVGAGPLDAAARSQLGTAREEVWRRVARAVEGAGEQQALGPVVRDALRVAGEHLDPTARLVLERSVVGIYENLYAAPIDDLSLLHSEEPFRLPGDDLTILAGFDTIVDAVTADLDVRCSTRVSRVERLGQSPARWRAHTPREHIDADGVVVTVPIGALHAQRISFDPPLPRDVVASLGRIGAGLVTKAFFTFDDDFWSPMWSFSTIGPARRAFELWVDASELAGRPVLCAFATGEHARQVESLGEAELCALAHRTLRDARVGAPPGSAGAS